MSISVSLMTLRKSQNQKPRGEEHSSRVREDSQTPRTRGQRTKVAQRPGLGQRRIRLLYSAYGIDADLRQSGKQLPQDWLSKKTLGEATFGPRAFSHPSRRRIGAQSEEGSGGCLGAVLSQHQRQAFLMEDLEHLLQHASAESQSGFQTNTHARLKRIAAYRGIRAHQRLPLRGQRTGTNAKTAKRRPRSSA